MVIDETLRKYPPAWVGPRRAVEQFEFEGHTVPARAFVNYSSWASHHLPDVFEEPEAFRPERFTPEAKAALPKGAYVPFGGGSRTCIGMRFGQLEVSAIATLMLARCHAVAAGGLQARRSARCRRSAPVTACRCASLRPRTAASTPDVPARRLSSSVPALSAAAR